MLKNVMAFWDYMCTRILTLESNVSNCMKFDQCHVLQPNYFWGIFFFAQLAMTHENTTALSVKYGLIFNNINPFRIYKKGAEWTIHQMM